MRTKQQQTTQFECFSEIHEVNFLIVESDLAAQNKTMKAFMVLMWSALLVLSLARSGIGFTCQSQKDVSHETCHCEISGSELAIGSDNTWGPQLIYYKFFEFWGSKSKSQSVISCL